MLQPCGWLAGCILHRSSKGGRPLLLLLQTLAVAKLLMGEGRLCAAAVRQFPAGDCQQSILMAAQSISQYSGLWNRGAVRFGMPSCVLAGCAVVFEGREPTALAAGAVARRGVGLLSGTGCSWRLA